MDKFNLPPQFKDLLDQNTALSGLVSTSLGEFGPWLERNNVKFFTEYTDHSLKHVEDVLREADELIREQCRGIVTPADIATLTLAVLLHDCAMHLSVDGFIELVQSDNRPLIQGFGDKPWKSLWSDFLAEARRFSGRKLMALFGNTEPVQYPPMNSQQMTGRDLLLIGEFLRRHHHRLAHEIALSGVPGPTDEKLKLITSDDTKFIIELAGVVARSHGMNIRDSIDYLKDNYSSEKIYKGIHTIFVMTLLRIADILQIQSSRAPRQVEKVQTLQSPVSLGEWEMHQAIKFINKNHDNPETIMVVAHPTNSRTYLRIRKALDQIQNELDTSWTVIGEVYGYNPQLREIGLKYRRIKSNIDDLDTFSKQVKYIPTQASFEVADSDLLKLLIGPLYGHRPEIGIRELLQNSLDAVRELREYQRQNPDLKDVELTQQDGDVFISIDQDDNGKWWIIVSDRGIGMTIETVRDYFLKAGASLRRNEIWRKTFEDEGGKSKVLRSGRFGIGALATFLLGDEISLSTRYVKNMATEGLEFTSQLDAEFIELRKIERPVGTTIRIGLSEETKNTLTKMIDHGYGVNTYYTQGDYWDWYSLDDPKVTRHISGKALQQKRQLPPVNSDMPVGWNRISCLGYDDIQWTYVRGKQKESGHSLVCNGIPIEDRFGNILSDVIVGFNDLDFTGGTLGFSEPNISVFDSNANLPLNLQRTELTSDKYPFKSELQESVIKDFIAYLLVNIPTQPLYQYPCDSWYESKNYHGFKGLSIGRDYLSPWFSTQSGVGLIEIQKHILQTKAKSAIILFDYASKSKPKTNKLDLKWIKGFEKKTLFFKYYSNEANATAINTRMSKAFMFGESLEFAFSYGKSFHYKKPAPFIDASRRVLINRKILNALKPLDDLSKEVITSAPRISKSELLAFTEWEDKDWILLKTGNCPKARFDFSSFAKQNQFSNLEEWPCILTELYFNKEEAETDSPMFEQAWNELLQSPIIPYDLKKRKKLFARAYKELDPFIKSHEAMKNKD